MPRWRLAAALLILVSLPLSTPQAHQQKAAITQIQFNERSGSLEVMHRFYLHDAEHAVRRLLDPAADIIANEQTRQQFAEYVAGKFTLYREDGSPLPLRLLGQEADGQFFWVYQELPVDAPPARVTARHDALRDLWPEQVNTVNIQLDGTIRTLTFTGDDRRLSADSGQQQTTP
ncbi:MAG: DUF6702 family protein [Pseudohongiellaceae bacterium]